MKAVILAAGRGLRMGRLTEVLPKPLLQLAGRPLITYVLDVLPNVVSELIVVVQYKAELIRDFLGNSYKGRPVTYVVQQVSGTGGGLQSARSHLLRDSFFLVVGADDIFGSGELDQLIGEVASYGIVCRKSSANMSGIVFNADGRLMGRVNVPIGQNRYFGAGAYFLPPTIFDQSFPKLMNGECSLPHSLPSQPFPVYVRHIQKWLSVNTPEDLISAEHSLDAIL